MTTLANSHYGQITFIMESIEIIWKAFVNYKLFELLRKHISKPYDNYSTFVLKSITNLYYNHMKFIYKHLISFLWYSNQTYYESYQQCETHLY